jgi:hypothetical protein
MRFFSLTQLQLQQVGVDFFPLLRAFSVEVAASTPYTTRRGLFTVDPDVPEILTVVTLR